MTNTLGCLVIDVAGTTLSPEDVEILNHPLVGGVIFFARHYESKAQLTALVKSIRVARKLPLLIMVDQEGGRVQRFIDGFTRLPAAACFGEIYNNDRAAALTLARDAGWLMAHEILSVGIDFSIAPVLDLNKHSSKAIGTRAFHATPKGVTALASAYIQGMHQAGMASTGKHFPGHGSVVMDSHAGMPIDNRPMDEVKREDLQPFAQLIQNGIKAILASHILFPAIDSTAAGFSHYWLTTVLRNELGFQGPILSDDLNMEGANISSSYADRIMAAREAGCDFALLCNNRSGVIQSLDNVPPESNQVSRQTWQVLAGDFAGSQRGAEHVDQEWRRISTSLNLLMEKQ